MEEQNIIENNNKKTTSNLTIIFVVLTVIFAITSILFLYLWLENSNSPRIEVSDDGYWIINGEKTNVLANNEEKFDDGRLEYTLVEGENQETYKITGAIDKTITEISIPKTYNNRTVTAIEANAFTGCTSLKTIIVPNSIISIAEGAFSGCSALESITLPFTGGSANLKIGDYQFPFGYIFGSSKFEGAEETRQAYYPSGTSVRTVADYYIPSSLKSVVVNDKFGGIDYSFINCKNIKNITLSGDVTTIGMNAFKGCTSLTSIVIPDSVTTIDAYAFKDCSSLSSIVIGKNVTAIGGYSFSGCYNLVEVINHSSLNITAGSEEYGYVGFYATKIHDGKSKIVD